MNLTEPAAVLGLPDTWRIDEGDCLEAMRALPDACIDAVVTDPPYEIGFMGKAWDSTGVAYSTETWAECLRVLRPGGHLLAFSATRTYHRMACAIEDAGFEIRDMVEWIYGTGFPKSKNLDGDWQGWGTALKPTHEPIVLARRPLTGTVAANVAEHGTGALNIDATRVGTEGGAGRWPANLILGPTSAADLDETSPEAKPKAAFFYVAKPSLRERDAGLDGFEEGDRVFMGSGGRTLVDGVWTETHSEPRPRKNTHPTVKPVALMSYLTRLVTRPGGIVLDPFAGSGSTGMGAVSEGFRFLGLEIDPDYCAIARARIAHHEGET